MLELFSPPYLPLSFVSGDKCIPRGYFKALGLSSRGVAGGLTAAGAGHAVTACEAQLGGLGSRWTLPALIPPCPKSLRALKTKIAPDCVSGDAWS